MLGKLAIASVALFIGLGAQTVPAAAQYFSIQSCHRQVLRHFHPAVGFRSHYHARGCRAITTPTRRMHCHRTVQRHFHPGVASRWHVHAGRSCYPVRVRIGR